MYFYVLDVYLMSNRTLKALMCVIGLWFCTCIVAMTAETALERAIAVLMVSGSAFATTLVYCIEEE